MLLFYLHCSVIYSCLQGLNEQTKNSFDAGILNQTELKKTVAMNTKMFPNGIPECGVDALRLTLCSHNIKGKFKKNYD